MRSVLLAVFYIGFVGVLITLVVMLVVPEIPALFGVSPDEPSGIWQALATLGIVVPLLFVAVYAGGLLWLWLCLACRLFGPDELEQFMAAGPNTRLETWILRRFSR